MRLQRRENYRIKLPLGQPVQCQVHWNPANPESLTSIRVADLSCGGLALVDFADSVKLVPGNVYADCRIGLGEIGTVTVDLEVVHVVEMTTRNNTRSRRCGCRFVKPPSAMGTLIQRYINKIERDQKAHT
jgi:c-di-GMP-binding flagellar brake protein YcgR